MSSLSNDKKITWFVEMFTGKQSAKMHVNLSVKIDKLQLN